MPKVDLKREFKHLYAPSVRNVQIVEVPFLNFAMIDGEIETGEMPGTSTTFQDAVGALYGISYTLKFMLKLRKDNPVDYTVMPLEGLWWTGSGQFDLTRKDDFRYTLMIMQPGFIGQQMFEAALEKLRAKKNIPGLARLRFGGFEEGLCMQIMHVGPYDQEAETIARMKAFASENGYRIRDRHHEIYLGDPRKARPEKLKTVLRYQIEKER